ncbi:hypothetical protein J8F10_07775 [Gemmata sp. G18]|uniref:Cytochrome c domain-containing protein n=1 Tax=Gemmata palustris TaxID=2822762 RepID=A0ABS5BNB5_9BACT|nr:di-heme-cytochrome C peroxidase [Gemmata palustris]MBP3955178.1 hypothetical protein [Gemmata palustris]
MIRFALALTLLAPVAVRARGADPIYLDQGWSGDERAAYYALPQGSEVMPYSWFLALEQPWAEKPFRDDAHIESFRYIPAAVNKFNPDGLPVGFTKGRGKDGKDWFGLTCAACHTGQFTYKGKTVRVDGGTALADALGFQSTLVTAVKATLAQPAKFDRFARRVLGEKHTPERAKVLATELREQLRVMADWEATSRPSHPGGYGVWDALGVLLNTITGTAPGTPDNYRVPSTPVSYPSIWSTNRYDRLLWNASVESVTLRQVGEVIIVFGRARATAGPDGKLTFESSADLNTLAKVYDYTSMLTPPAWPEDVLGKIDRDLAKRGEKIYQDQKCATCHPLAPYPTVEAKAGGRKLIKTTATPLKEVGTDPLYAEYFTRRTAVPGALAPVFKGTMFEGQQEVPAAIQFLATLTRITEADLDRAAKTPADRARLLGDRPLPQLPKTPAELQQLVSALHAYKATPLTGVWSTAPYLHNGSVANLYELLLPPEKRMKSFYLGHREFDPKHVGHRTGPFEHGYKYDTALPGYSNRGHEYGTGLADGDRWALVEYLKTL